MNPSPDPRPFWNARRLALALGVFAALAVVLTLHMLDHLVNAMLNPVFMLAAGGLARMCWIGLQVISGPTRHSTASSRESFRRKRKTSGPRICMRSMPRPISEDCS